VEAVKHDDLHYKGARTAKSPAKCLVLDQNAFANVISEYITYGHLVVSHAEMDKLQTS
jgi:hypothetical protein